MERTILLLVLSTAVEGDTGKHIFVPEKMIWSDAQIYCRNQYTDLSYVRSQSGVDRLRKAAGESNPQGWIGLHRDLNNLTGWKWSGGGHMTYQNWCQEQPDNHRNIETSVNIFNENGEWNDDAETQQKDFYCINITVVEYEAWPQGDQDHQCPIYKRCGALTKEGLWENWDCKEKLNFICI
ncbi:hypothetical protein KUCAC02_016275 [Chaenocephalus aceratus]|uniref:Uncharacterized protein n=1 Tax=Chaenocephalus aceratus TaxID=36190 RepID=A0ACB9Y1A5_CHAAC|nr:hypothetical protein KUCAC02_016275 [Chaenocephalus aceratus]